MKEPSFYYPGRSRRRRRLRQLSRFCLGGAVFLLLGSLVLIARLVSERENAAAYYRSLEAELLPLPRETGPGTSALKAAEAENLFPEPYSAEAENVIPDLEYSFPAWTPSAEVPAVFTPSDLPAEGGPSSLAIPCPDWAALRAINPEAAAWLYIPSWRHTSLRTCRSTS